MEPGSVLTVGEALSLPRSITHKYKPGWANSYDVRHDTIQRNTQFRYVAGGYEPPLQLVRCKPSNYNLPISRIEKGMLYAAPL